MIAASTLIAYLTGPVTAISLRKIAPQLQRPFKPNYMKFLAPLAFVLTSLAIYWSMWPTTIQIIFVIALGLPVYIYYELKYQKSDLHEQLQHAWWIIVYLVGMSLMSYCGSSGFGGQDWIKYPWDFVLIIVVSLLFYYWGIHTSKNKPDPAAVKINQKAQ